MALSENITATATFPTPQTIYRAQAICLLLSHLGAFYMSFLLEMRPDYYYRRRRGIPTCTLPSRPKTNFEGYLNQWSLEHWYMQSALQISNTADYSGSYKNISSTLPLPSAPSGSAPGLWTSDKIALGVGLAVGLPLLWVSLYRIYAAWREWFWSKKLPFCIITKLCYHTEGLWVCVCRSKEELQLVWTMI